LDVDIWSLKDARDRDRTEVRDLMTKADAALVKIRRILDSWDRPDVFDSEHDWHKMQEIKRRINASGTRDWLSKPPWVDAQEVPM